MVPSVPSAPRPLYGIRNFRWAEHGIVACGEYPHDEASWRVLQQAAFHTVVCLRAEEEPAKAEWPAYRLADQRDACEAAGLQILHVPADDYEALKPATVCRALEIIDQAVASGSCVYVHCMAGVGRTGVVVNAWSITRGLSSDEAVGRFYAGTRHRWDLAWQGGRHEPWPDFVRRVRADEQLWEVEAVAAALGRPVTVRFDDLQALRPPDSRGWEQEFEECLRPWRERPGGGSIPMRRSAADPG